MKHIKLFEGFVHLDSKSGIIQGVYDFFISNYSDELLNMFDLFQDCEDEGLALGISVLYTGDEIGQYSSVSLFHLDSNLKSINSLDDRWFKTRLINQLNIAMDDKEVVDGFHPDLLDVVLSITKRDNRVKSISYHDRIDPIIFEYVDRVKSTCGMELDKEAHSGLPQNPDIYTNYRFFLRFL